MIARVGSKQKRREERERERGTGSSRGGAREGKGQQLA